MHAVHAFTPEGYMPLNLKGVLAQHGISQSEWARAIRQSNGRPLSASLTKRILNYGYWPTKTPRHSIEEQTVAFLRERGVADSALDGIWEPDVEDQFRNAMPIGKTGKIEPRGNGARTGEERDEDIQLPEAEMLTQHAQKHFHLFRDPFQDDVQTPEDVFVSSDQRYVRESMFLAARQGGFLAVVGESGAGKSVLRRDLVDRIRREGHPIRPVSPRTIDKAQLTAAGICQAIIEDLSDERPRRTLEAQARQIERILTESSRAGSYHVLIIEEAHDLHIETLKFLKRFWELEDGFRRLLGIVLIGQPELMNKLDERRYPSAREVIRRCVISVLDPLDENLEAYLAHKLKRIGADVGAIFDPSAFEALRAGLVRDNGRSVESFLYPLIVNSYATKGMNLAAEVGAAKVDAEIIRGVFGHAR